MAPLLNRVLLETERFATNKHELSWLLGTEEKSDHSLLSAKDLY